MGKLILRYGSISLCGLAVLLLAGTAGGGRGKLTLCHAPPGNPSNAHEITVGKGAAESHLRRHAGDSIGACPERCNAASDCDDGNACTVDVCKSDGSCDSSQAVVCDDGDLCTIDFCDPDSGCGITPDPDCGGGPCCDPDVKPNCFGTTTGGGASCCGDGTWACNDPVTGIDNCPGDLGPVCGEDLCCDPGEEPGVGGNPFCFEGATCCDDGTWRCNAGDGTDTCADSVGDVCEDPGCCDPDVKPNCFGTSTGGGASCCADGTWACNDPVTGIDNCPGDLGPVCGEDLCCDPDDEPGVGGNPFCFEGATCCDDGTWHCNAGDGTDTCTDSVGLVCEDGQCCDPDLKPACFGTVGGGGATCCEGGAWRCNDPQTGVDTCPGDVGPVCGDMDSCDPTLPPGDPEACGGCPGDGCFPFPSERGRSPNPA